MAGQSSAMFGWSWTEVIAMYCPLPLVKNYPKFQLRVVFTNHFVDHGKHHLYEGVGLGLFLSVQKSPC